MSQTTPTESSGTHTHTFTQLSGELSDAQHGVRAVADAHGLAQVTGELSDAQHGVRAVADAHGLAQISGTVSDTQHGVRTLANAHPHADLSGITADQHQPRSHDHSQAADGTTLAPVTLTIPAANIATQAETEAETAGKLITAALAKNLPGVAKVWCVIDAAGALAAPDYNVDSVTDTGVGDATVVLGTDFSSDVYSADSVPSTGGGGFNCPTSDARTLAVGSLISQAYNTPAVDPNTTVFADFRRTVICHGDQ